MRHGVPGIKMKDDLLLAEIIYFEHTGKGSTGHILL